MNKLQVEAKGAQVRGWVQISRQIPFIKSGVCWGWKRYHWQIQESGQGDKARNSRTDRLGGWYQRPMTIDKAPIFLKAPHLKELITLN